MRYFFTCVLLAWCILIKAQSPWCGASQYQADHDSYQSFLQKVKTAGDHPSIQFRTKKYFQVVIHVVARDGFQPVSVAQVQQQLDVLNADFAARGENIGKLQEQFIDLVQDSEFHFCLASVDPDGNPTTGITFTQTDIEDIGIRYGDFQRRIIHYDESGKAGWDPTRYINIWVAENAGILGTATMPGEALYDEEIGLVMDIHHFGTIGDAGGHNEYGRGHTLTHEMGHFFGLKHIWGDGFDESCDDSDDIDDTPNAAGPNYHCPSGIGIASCGEFNMYQNFMDLTNDFCLAAFTKDQVTRMQTVVDVFYPDLDSEGSCIESVSEFNDWFDQLIVSTDPLSDKIVLYNPLSNPEAKVIHVYSMDGKELYKGEWGDELTELIELNNVAAGVYVVNVRSGDDCESRKVAIY